MNILMIVFKRLFREWRWREEIGRVLKFFFGEVFNFEIEFLKRKKKIKLIKMKNLKGYIINSKFIIRLSVWKVY